MTKGRISILCVDDHRLVLAGLRLMIERQPEIREKLEPIANRIRTALSQIGINVTLTPLSQTEYQDHMINKHDAPMFVSDADRPLGPDVGYCALLWYVSASKGGLVALTHALAVSLGPDIRVNCVSPGWVRTPMADQSMTAIGQMMGTDREGAYRIATKNVPIRRPGTSEEIANIILFLACEDSAVITGAVIMADGKLVTPPLGASVLPGITRESVITIARSMGLEVVG